MFGIFKKKLSTEEAAAVYLATLGRRIKDSWESDEIKIKEIIEMLEENELKLDPNIVQYDIFLAVIALELNVVMNLKPEKYNRIYNNIIICITSEESTRDYAISTVVDEYMPAIKRAEIDNLPPYNDMLFILLEKLDLNKSVFLATLMQEVLFTKLGTWKKIFEKFRIV